MAPIGSERVAAINAVTRLLVLAVGDRGIVSVQNPIRLTQRSEPQPDFAVLESRDDYRTTLPRPEDTMLAIELSDTSLDYDRDVKLALYARSGIPEVWIVNLAVNEVEVYQAPVADSCTFVARAGRSDVLTIKAIPGVLIPECEKRGLDATCNPATFCRTHSETEIEGSCGGQFARAPGRTK
jgi:hypothetical protein